MIEKMKEWISSGVCFADCENHLRIAGFSEDKIKATMKEATKNMWWRKPKRKLQVSDLLSFEQ